MASSLILKVNSSSMNAWLSETVVAISMNEFLLQLDGVFDNQFLDEIESGDPKNYIKNTYGEDRELHVLIFYKDLPPTPKCILLRKLFPGVKIVLITMDIHCVFNTKAHSVRDCDRLISMTYPFLFKRFYNIDVIPKLLHWGNRCPEQFVKSEPNFHSIDALFYYGVEYPVRNDFLVDADRYWEVVRHPRSSAGETAVQLYKYTYAFTTGYDYWLSTQKSQIYYLVSKFFEIMGSGCLMLCDHRGVMLQLKELGFFENQHYLNVNGEKSSKVSEYVKNHPDKVREIRIRAHQLVTSKYTIKKACEDINQKLLSIVDGPVLPGEVPSTSIYE